MFVSTLPHMIRGHTRTQPGAQMGTVHHPEIQRSLFPGTYTHTQGHQNTQVSHILRLSSPPAATQMGFGSRRWRIVGFCRVCVMFNLCALVVFSSSNIPTSHSYKMILNFLPKLFKFTCGVLVKISRLTCLEGTHVVLDMNYDNCRVFFRELWCMNMVIIQYHLSIRNYN